MYSLTSMFVLGLDSFVSCLAIGSHSLSWRERLRLALAFGACDATATLLGTMRPHRVEELAVFPVYVLCALLIVRAYRPGRRLLYALPVLLSIDNLFSGDPVSMVPATGFGSAAMALLGVSLAAACRPVFVKSEGFA
jgi:hypothetical protein